MICNDTNILFKKLLVQNYEKYFLISFFIRVIYIKDMNTFSDSIILTRSFVRMPAAAVLVNICDDLVSELGPASAPECN